MFKIINKYKISILWGLSFTIFFGSMIISRFKPFNGRISALILWSFLNSALLAMLFSAIKNKNKFEITAIITAIITAMIIFTIKIVF